MVTPRLAYYDYILVNSSAGKDSQAMLDRVVELADQQRVPRNRIVVVHSNLGRVEWKGTSALAKQQAEHYGLRYLEVERSQDLLDHVEQRGMWPSSAARYCTSDHKRDQISKVMTSLVRECESPGRPVRILNCLGMRADESPARAKLKPIGRDDRASNGRRFVIRWLPIHDWTAKDVWSRIKASGVPHHPAYDLGMPRLSCCFCIMAPRNALMLAGKHNPELLNEYVRVELKIGHTFRKDFKIASIKAALDGGEEPGPVCNWRM